ncbi:trypsin [Nesidiocoris tenuis]|uniref:Trypsin n=1 Tax=Nesidiocoris tenuis TaxID=355587 RepID=A0ABN7BHN1_9HEMI|nr:trypsin [Nesidiocoris tenuis]
MGIHTSANCLLLIGLVTTLGGSDDKIIGGHLAPSVPFLVSVQESRRHRCGGSLLTVSEVLTACHCIGQFSKKQDDPVEYISVFDPSIFRIHAGDRDLLGLSPDAQTRRGKAVNSHPKCKMVDKSPQFDFAVIVTVTPFNWTSHVHPIGLYSASKALYDSRIASIDARSNCWVLGWGKTLSHKSTRYLRMARMKVVPARICRRLLSSKDPIYETHEFDEKAQLCALGVNGSESDCTGDSGGPFICDGDIVGVVSYGFECGRNDSPAVYAKMSDFVEWYASIKSPHLRKSSSRRTNGLTLFRCAMTIYLLWIMYTVVLLSRDDGGRIRSVLSS